jgi:hypothetical protein
MAACGSHTIDVHDMVAPVSATTMADAAAQDIDGDVESSSSSDAPTFDVTGSVQQWISSDGTNYGLGLSADDESTASGGVEFGSSRSDDPPSLTVQYVAPHLPGTPRNVSVAPGDSGCEISWASPEDQGSAAGVTGYNVTVAGPSGTVVNSTSTGSESAVVTGLVDGTAYSVSVTATNTVGQSSVPAASTCMPVSSTETSALSAAAEDYETDYVGIANGQFADAVSATAGQQSVAPQIVGVLAANQNGLAAGYQSSAATGSTFTAPSISYSNVLVTLTGQTYTVYLSADISQTETDSSGTQTPQEDTEQLAEVFMPVASAYQMVGAYNRDAVSASSNDMATDSVQAAQTPASTNANPSADRELRPAMLPAPDNGSGTPVHSSNNNWFEDGAAMVTWANDHWEGKYYTRKNGDDCTNFASFALNDAGGVPRIHEHWWQDHNDLTKWDEGIRPTFGIPPVTHWSTLTWDNSDALYNGLVITGRAQEILRFSDVLPGDLIFFTYTGGVGKYEHTAIVTKATANDIWWVQHGTDANTATYANSHDDIPNAERKYQNKLTLTIVRVYYPRMVLAS